MSAPARRPRGGTEAVTPDVEILPDGTTSDLAPSDLAPSDLAPSDLVLSDLARAHTATAIKALFEVAKSGGTDAARVSAANALLDRGWGRPRQEMAMEEAVLDLAELIARRRRQVAEGRE